MKLKQIILGTLVYAGITFPIAVLWHVVVFKDLYQSFRYIEGEPNFLLGLITILMQGIILSALYPFVNFSGKAIIRGLKFSLSIGFFFWTSHVLAFIAKQNIDNTLFFIIMESFYLLLQFGIFGVLIGLIYAKK
ncbi:MAG: hypothetical protein DWQ05_16100 [Calditrichaeota bacterium]|nr:MAG: hypothetical protein DWQ05_16100 [Calditrichota bacterium]